MAKGSEVSSSGSAAGDDQVVLTFASGKAPIDEIQEELDAISKELRDPNSDAARRAAELGVDPSQLPSFEAKVETKQGFAGADILIQIGIAIAKDVAEKLWTDVIWPRIRKRIGPDGLGERKKS
jgi:hypothetical protein